MVPLPQGRYNIFAFDLDPAHLLLLAKANIRHFGPVADPILQALALSLVDLVEHPQMNLFLHLE
jgi:hypothetical protein